MIRKKEKVPFIRDPKKVARFLASPEGQKELGRRLAEARRFCEGLEKCRGVTAEDMRKEITI